MNSNKATRGKILGASQLYPRNQIWGELRPIAKKRMCELCPSIIKMKMYELRIIVKKMIICGLCPRKNFITVRVYHQGKKNFFESSCKQGGRGLWVGFERL